MPGNGCYLPFDHADVNVRSDVPIAESGPSAYGQPKPSAERPLRSLQDRKRTGGSPSALSSGSATRQLLQPG